MLIEFRSWGGDRAKLRDRGKRDASLFVHDALDFRGRGFSIRCLVIAAVVPRLLAFPLEFLIAVVGFPNAIVLGLGLRCGNRDDRHVIFVVSQGEPPSQRQQYEGGHATRFSAMVSGNTFHSRPSSNWPADRVGQRQPLAAG